MHKMQQRTGYFSFPLLETCGIYITVITVITFVYKQGLSFSAAKTSAAWLSYKNRKVPAYSENFLDCRTLINENNKSQISHYRGHQSMACQ